MATPTVQLNVRIPLALARRIQRAAAAAGMTQQRVVIDTLETGLPPAATAKAKGEQSQ